MSNYLMPGRSETSNDLLVPKHPRPSNTATISSSNLTPQFFLNPNYPKSKQGSSSASNFRLSRTNTNTTDAYAGGVQDAQSIQTIDRIPSAKPSVTYSDRLWTQIDVLDDVKRMAEEVRVKGSFFDEKFTREMEKLKISQQKLMETMSLQRFDDMSATEDQNQQLYQLNSNTLPTNPTVTRSASNATSGGRGHLEVPDRRGQPRGGTGEGEDDGELEATSNASRVSLKDEEEAKTKKQQEKINKFFADDEVRFETLAVYNKEKFDEINGYVQNVKQDLMNLGEAIKHFDDSTKDMW
ncbi:uncharacterized protein LODBEIA_P16800 [Lodderomyces beijingensis]|uniref:Uncharacterized protein n=1 Tax=Lodderomyces beijingensis TaxID=1775926 RepID=A0ABP0ZKP3_9ASCO